MLAAFSAANYSTYCSTVRLRQRHTDAYEVKVLSDVKGQRIISVSLFKRIYSAALWRLGVTLKMQSGVCLGHFYRALLFLSSCGVKLG